MNKVPKEIADEILAEFYVERGKRRMDFTPAQLAVRRDLKRRGILNPAPPVVTPIAAAVHAIFSRGQK